MLTDIKFIFPKKLYSEGAPVVFTPIELMIFGIISSFEIINSNSFRLNNWANYQNLIDTDIINIIIQYTESNGLRS